MILAFRKFPIFKKSNHASVNKVTVLVWTSETIIWSERDFWAKKPSNLKIKVVKNLYLDNRWPMKAQDIQVLGKRARRHYD